MKKLYYLYSLLLLSVFSYTCKDPTEDFTIQIEPNIFKYQVQVQISEVRGAQLPANMTVTILGPDAEAIYSSDGTKQYAVNSGLVSLAVNPKVNIDANQTLQFNVLITSPNMLDVNIPVTITSNQHAKVLPVEVLNLANLSTPSTGFPPIAFQKPEVPVTNGTTTTDVSIGTTTQVEIPAGTVMRDETGVIIGATKLNSVLVTLNPNDATAMELFPGGSMASNNVLDENNQIVSGVFNPSGLAFVELNAGGVAVKTFSKPVEIDMPVTATGGTLSIYSYDVKEGQWQYETDVPVVNGRVSFTTTHLTAFAAVIFTRITGGLCSEAGFTLNGNYVTGVDYPVTIDVMSASGDVIMKSIAIVNSENRTIVISNFPATAGTSVRFFNGAGVLLGSAAAGTTSCQNVTAVPVTFPASTKVTMRLYVQCPGTTTNIEVIPTFFLYYSESTDPSNYILLGIVTKGYLSTTALSPSKVYNFKATWNQYTKIVPNKTVKADNETTVGEGLDLGKNPESNLDLLTQACQDNL
ncbi:hypothetical protein [Pedobacter metabolipauper]|uniref:Calx-beta domain-containing protein n=1 Tax=Pedobacter metabolipauper TaxID=425513 RepID=A0A4R6SW10_9SPHI|nr:hypothetical protein [Pedobacter metabolipauper]TDQ10000.1 hypothetical protein ATK78_2159 [Pedobacter metabolipauper]